MTQLKQKGDLFSVKVKKEKKGSKGKKKKSSEKQDTSEKKTTKNDHLSNIDVQPLTYKSLTVGQVLLGCVSEVRDYELVVSLPHKLVGSVSLAHISRPYTALLSKLKDEEEGEEEIQALQDLYRPGQYVVCSVVSIERPNNMTKVSLTLMPNEVNFGIPATSLEKGLVLPCAVSSVEDKGYTLDTGLPKVKAAFLKKDDTDKTQTVGVGSVLRCVITNIYGSDTKDNLRLTFSAHPKAVTLATLDLSDTTNLALLLPGTAVNTTVSKVRSDALTLMLAGLDGVVSPVHLAEPFHQLQHYTLGDSVRARVLYVAPLSKVVHFTLQGSVCAKGHASETTEGHKIGDIIEEAEIYRSSPSGIYLSIGERTRGFCSANHLSDNPRALKHINRDFRVGKKMSCRLLKYNHMDQIFIVSLQKSVLEQQVIAYSELHPGQVVEATITGYDNKGARLALGKHINGHVPTLHLSDTTMKHPQRKHIQGDKVTARVLKVNAKRQHVLLTLKSELVTAKDILTEYSREAENSVTVGYVIKVLPQGLLVGMFNDVKGFVPRSQISELGRNLTAVFREGQVVRCRVLSVCPEKSNVTLSLLLDGEEPVIEKHKPKIEMRRRVKCVVEEVRSHVIVVTILPYNIEASIPVYHLSDDLEKSQAIRDVIREGDVILNAIVFSRLPGSPITLTLKPSVCFWVDRVDDEGVCDREELVAGDSYPSVVCTIKTFGIFVITPTGNNGNRSLVHIKNIMNPGKWIDSKNMGISVGQSIYVTYKEKDDKGRPILSSALKDNLKNNMQSSLQLLYSYLKNEEVVRSGYVNRRSEGKELAKFNVGDKVVGVVSKLTSDEVCVAIKNGVLGQVPLGHQHKKSGLKVGQKVKATVLHVNQEHKRLDLTLRPNLIFNLTTGKNDDVKVGMKVKCEVVLSDPNYVMVMMRSACKGSVAYISSRMHLNILNNSSTSNMTVGKRCWVVVKYKEGEMVLGVLSCHNSTEHFTLDTQLPEICFNHTGNSDSEEEEEEERETNTPDIEKQTDEKEVTNKRTLKEEKKGKKAKKIKHDMGNSDSEEEKETNTKIEKQERQTDEKQITNKRTLKEEKEGKKTKKMKANGEEINTRKRQQGQDEDEMQLKKRKKMDKLKSERKCDDSFSDDNNEKNKETEEMEEEEEQEEEEEGGESEASERPKPCLSVGSAFVWEVPDTTEATDNSDSDDEDIPKKREKKQRKTEVMAQVREEERRLHQLELSRLEDGRKPQTAMDYEAMLQASPNSSAVWIQFISFHLESAEVDKAKAIAKRALQIIDTQEEEERLNLWTVLLRLEVTYGAPESVAEVYKEALATNDPLKVHTAMAMVYAESDKLKEAERVFFNMSKKFGQELSVWVKAGIFFFSHNMSGEGRRYFERALKSLEKKDHVELINRFGQLEFRFGEAERGRTMFESLLSTYWKRTDIWSVYVDLLTKHKDIDGARHVLERMTALKLRIRKMRFVFKKFLEFEKEHGTPQSVEAVRKRVEEYVAAAIH